LLPFGKCDLSVHENVPRRWVKEFGAGPQQAFPGHGQMKPEQLEIQRLRREERESVQLLRDTLASGGLSTKTAERVLQSIVDASDPPTTETPGTITVAVLVN
jgi:transposase-like protein